MFMVLLCFLIQNSITSQERKSSGLSWELTQGKSGWPFFQSKYHVQVTQNFIVSFLTLRLTFHKSCFKPNMEMCDPECFSLCFLPGISQN